MRLCFLIAFVALTPALSAQPLTWEPIGGPYDGFVRDLHALPSGEVFATSGRALYRSDDSGRTWAVTASPTEVYDLEADGEALVVAGPGGVYRSEDAGATWTLLGLDDVGATQVAVGPNGLLLAFAGEDVYHSTDGGATWQRAEGDVATGSPRSAVITPAGIMAVVRSYFGDLPWTVLYRSWDGGETWLATSPGFLAANFVLGENEEIFATGSEWSSFDFYIPPGFYRSANSGATWTRLYQGAASGGGRLADGRLWVGTTSGLRLSEDEGETWSAPVIETAAAPSASLLPDGALLAGSGTYCHSSWEPPTVCVRSGGLYRLGPDDEGPRQVGLREGTASVLAWGAEGDLLAATPSNVLRWSGEGWEPLPWRGGSVEDVVALGDDVLVASPDVYGVVRLSDGASLLEAEGCYEYDCGVRALARDADGTLFASAAALFYGEGAGLFRSDDHGETWTVSLPDINNVEVFAVAADGTVYAGTGGEPPYVGVPGSGVYRSADGGDTWDSLTEGLSGGVTALAAGPGGTVYAGAESEGVLRLSSSDVWEPFGLDGRAVSALAVTEREQEVAATDAGVFVHDGVNWVSGGLSHPTAALLLGPDGTGYAATDQGVFRSVGSVVVDVEGEGGAVGEAALDAYPNPSAGSATVVLVVAESGPVAVAVYDLLGRRVAVLHDGPLPTGTHRLAFDRADLPSGTYLVRAEGDRLHLTRRVTLVR